MKHKNKLEEEYPVAIRPVNIVKLSLLFVLFLVVYSVPAVVIGRRTAKTKTVRKLGVSFVTSFPFLQVLFYLLRHRKAGRIDFGTLANIRFSRSFPLLLQYDPKGYLSSFQNEDVKVCVKKGDIILRRNQYYLDSFILNQTSFFTHAGICTGVDNGEPQIFEAVGANGVSKVRRFADFIRSEDIAILRLSESRIEKFDDHMTDTSTLLADKNNRMTKLWKDFRRLQLSRHIINKENAKRLLSSQQFHDSYLSHMSKGEIEAAIENEIEELHGSEAPTVGSRQFDVFKTLRSKSKVPIDNCTDVIANMPTIYEGRHYDYFFDFSNPDTMSCVEFVWHCFKSLFPVHKVKERPIKWFRDFGPLAIDTLVILPDDFVSSPAFDLIYTSVKNSTGMLNKEELINYIDKNKSNPIKFTCKLIGFEILAICTFLGAYSLVTERPQTR
jgi:hypothetical protein